jgi:hypothetical protein
MQDRFLKRDDHLKPEEEGNENCREEDEERKEGENIG